MSVQHHVSDALLLDYASGSLAEGWSLAVATHLALSPESRKRLACLEAAAGTLMDMDEVETPVNLDQSWQSMRERLAASSDLLVAKRPVASPVAAKVQAMDVPVLPEPLRSYLGRDAAQLQWKSLGRGAYHIPIKTNDGETSVRLLRIPAGKPVPEHSHGGRELTLVLKGSYHDGYARFARGDLEEADETLEHQPIADVGEDCICLAVTDAPLRFKSKFLRLVQPLLGI
ncbi:ChrR family anti-sigma-E factor [Rhizobium oryziradicis]|uniref:Transcriptional regulator n=1 Tax=Rhizobium oryziradicis TaxID=1867956 RepID=A0A1Q8ZTG1_9HYPH|nr:ChrR family anti-sigma-E factor [Rhizobium oryziradicis]OLP45380.1 transcriptional regulator [Rhizobium oryziradicis]